MYKMHIKGYNLAKINWFTNEYTVFDNLWRIKHTFVDFDISFLQIYLYHICFDQNCTLYDEYWKTQYSFRGIKVRVL